MFGRNRKSRLNNRQAAQDRCRRRLRFERLQDREVLSTMNPFGPVTGDGGEQHLPAAEEATNDAAATLQVGHVKTPPGFGHGPRFQGGVNVASGDVNGDGQADIIVGAGLGGGPHVRVIDAQAGETLHNFFAYPPGFTGGVRVAAGDINGDGFDDIITGAGAGGGPHVKVFDGASGNTLGSFFAYDAAFSGGVQVASGDVNGDGFDDIITGAGAGGGPHVKVFSGADNSVLSSFFAFSPGFKGGVHVAAGDVSGDGQADIIVGAGASGGPHVKVFSGATGAELFNFLAYSPNFLGGVRVAAGDVNGDGTPEIITAAGPGGGPHVKVFSGRTAELTSSFAAYHPAFRGGVFVAAGDVDGDGRADIVTSAGLGGGPHVKVFSGADSSELLNLHAFRHGFRGGVRVAIGDVDGDGDAHRVRNRAGDLGRLALVDEIFSRLGE